MTLIGYARVSTPDQNVDLQTDALKKAGCSKIFTDTISGAREERAGLSSALNFMREADVLVVWRLDRLGRSLKHLIVIIAALEERGIGFRSLTEAMDSTTPAGRLIFHVFGAIGQFERELIRERTNAGLSAAAARGRTGGRKPVVSEDILQKAKILIAQKLTVREAAARLKVGKTALYTALKDSSETVLSNPAPEDIQNISKIR